MALASFSKPFHELKAFPKLFSDYVLNQSQLRPFFGNEPNSEGILNQVELKKKSFSKASRNLLAETLESQMSQFAIRNLQAENLKKLRDENTFSISCGHQLNVAGGPMYLAFKILTVIKYCQYLNQEFPDFHFVPIHWLANEDHDLEEISDFTFFGQSQKINLQGSGASGRVSTEGISGQLAEIKDIPREMLEAYSQNPILNLATQAWLQTYFGEMGLLFLDADQKVFKQEFSALFLKELKENWVEKSILPAEEKLERLGYKAQIHARPINLFYLAEKERLRIEKNDSGFQSQDGKYHWNQEEGFSFFQSHPELLSPNVALRPLYSQVLLPDVGFVGGPAEISYWLQLKGVFEQANVPFPVLIPRFSGLYINLNQAKKMEKLGLGVEDLFKETHQLKKEVAEIQWQKPNLEMVYGDFLRLAQGIDPTLVPSLKAELAKMEKQMEGFEKRVQKAAEQKNEQQINQIINLLAKLFPDEGLQERKESWLSFVVSKPDWLLQVLEQIQPFQFDFRVMVGGEKAD
jgi:bacillithiol biosynthesis cysteine-adding enzyme BshC